MSKRIVLGGLQSGDKLLQLVDQPTGMDDALQLDYVRLEVTGGQMTLTLSQLRRLKEVVAHAERVLVSRHEHAHLARNLPLPL